MSKIFNQDVSVLGKLSINPSNEVTTKVLTMNVTNEVTYRTLTELASDGADKTYTHSQGAASTTWNIAHGLNKNVSVMVVDSSNRVIIGQVDYVDANNITVSFNAAFSGAAYIN